MTVKQETTTSLGKYYDWLETIITKKYEKNATKSEKGVQKNVVRGSQTQTKKASPKGKKGI